MRVNKKQGPKAVKKTVVSKRATVAKAGAVKKQAPAPKKTIKKKAAAAKTTTKVVATKAVESIRKGNTFYGIVNDARVPSRILEENIQMAVEEGLREIHIKANGQHGIGGRIWKNKEETVRVVVEGPVGQRLGSMGFPDTEIIVKNSVSDDVGWINCGAKITVLGDVTNGAFNAAAQGILYVQGGGGARCDTMTKRNPRFDPPQSWYFRNVGDSFAEFKAGGISVVCGVDSRNPENILGYRPCVGMVGGTIYFRGPIQGYSDKDVKLLDLTEQDWDWLRDNMKPYLEAIDRMSYYEELTRSSGDWKKLIAYTPQEKMKRRPLKMSASEFRKNVWEKGVGQGGIFAEYLDHDLTILPYITTAKDRRNKPVWANEKYAPPCAYACPTYIPSHKRAALIREGKLNEALELVLQYSPLPATVCGEICPNLCMQSCTRGRLDKPLAIDKMGKLSLDLPAPKKDKPTGHRISVIGGGPAGMSVAWQLAIKGHTVDLYESTGKLGGKLELCIPEERLPRKIIDKETERFRELGVNLHLNADVGGKQFDDIYRGSEVVVLACGAHQPRKMTFPGSDDIVSAYDFLRNINLGTHPDLKGKKIAIIGAGNVGMDVASEAFNYGAESVTAVDIQKPAAFGREMEIAKAKGTQVLWPKFTDRFDKQAGKLYFKDGTTLDADYVIMSVGDIPRLDFLPPSIHTERGWASVNDTFQTSDVKVFAIGDVTALGLVTHAIGHGRLAAENIHYQIMHAPRQPEVRSVVPYERIKTEYYEMCKGDFPIQEEGNRCMSCATCRDCHMCEATCYWGAISRNDLGNGRYEYVVDEDKCIGCGFCAGTCPCGVWEMVENV
jgi:NADPH-dependent glutamate synthase beta subunit-like oxidoreductase/glutamate synthase domain-containing protein 3/NAD-dependent dihydropyrimidine dehydrogenase PreA subunit